MKFLITGLMVLSTSAFAHFEIGTYKGSNNINLPCEIEFVKKAYFPNIKNPLNEIVTVKVHKYGVFTVGHQAMIDSDKKTVTADKNRLTGAVGFKGSALALEIKMDHEKNAPSSYNVIVHEWKNNKSIMYTCDDLEFIK